MRVFVAGVTGAIGAPLLDALLSAGHEVTGLTRSPERADALRARGAGAAVADALDRDAVLAAVAAARPDVVVNQLTALPAELDLRRYAEQLEPTNRLRREAGPLLVEAARAAGARRIVAQSIAFLLAPEGPPVGDEDSRPWSDAPEPFGATIGAALTLERAMLEADGIEGVVLRYGFFYGPGTAYGPGGSSTEMVRRRRFPVIGAGTGRWSWIHVDDAAAATVAALDGGPPGLFNVTDDEPAEMREWLPAFAAAVGARRPFRVPAVVARLAAGRGAVEYGVRLRGAANAKARRELGWAPRHASWREGFPASLRSEGDSPLLTTRGQKGTVPS